MLNLIEIEDVNIPELQLYKQLRDNAFTQDNSFIADSPKVINLLLESDLKIKSILSTKEYYEEFEDLIRKKDIEKLYVATKKELESIVGHTVHHNAMMHGIRPEPTPLEALGDKIIMLDEISSTQNVGSIARSAAALGVNSYLLPKQGPHPYSRRSLRVSMGYVSKLQIHIYENIIETIEVLKQAGYTILAAEVTNESIELAKLEVPEKWVLIMGHEGKGISKEILDLCDKTVKIEMVEGIKSFNVSVAASIMMYKLIHS
ncbi:TrmH family RNA methyltransferase [Sulfurimonas microaerophilic]|uniref:TrmH family RNA methyltransferase n=1 Tax=Sulfurimonas microaerophilic TaxID=3058392 RepID=UPI0027155477|nr:RNA methyltransferase [Sulfurimonas sp. hsl 1-7]